MTDVLTMVPMKLLPFDGYARQLMEYYSTLFPHELQNPAFTSLQISFAPEGGHKKRDAST
jgi:hypothetical protein